MLPEPIALPNTSNDFTCQGIVVQHSKVHIKQSLLFGGEVSKPVAHRPALYLAERQQWLC